MTSLAERIAELEELSADATIAKDELRSQLEDAKIETEIADSERRKYEAEARRQEAEVARLRTALAENGLAGVAWNTPPDEPGTDYPDDFEELVLLWDCAFERVVFTGDQEKTLALYQADSAGNWARKTWDALLALEGYATLKATHGFAGGVHQYLSETPPGCRGFSINRFASSESDTVNNTPRFRNPRTLPVPEEVEPSGRVYMPAHFKIASAGQISPRMHFFDDVDRTGRVYVGYIGKHLPNTMTS